MWRHAVGEVEHHLVQVAPAPAFRRIISFDDRMFRPVKMLCRMFMWRGIAASHVSASPANSQMHPRGTCLQTFLAAKGARRHVFDRVKMAARFRHGRNPLSRQQCGHHLLTNLSSLVRRNVCDAKTPILGTRRDFSAIPILRQGRKSSRSCKPAHRRDRSLPWASGRNCRHRLTRTPRSPRTVARRATVRRKPQVAR